MGVGDVSLFGDGCSCPLVAMRDGRAVLSRSPRCDVHGPAVRAQRDQFAAGLDALRGVHGALLADLGAVVAPRRSWWSRLWGRR